VQLSRTRADVETAWHQKNYRRVIEMYDSMLEDLTPAEAKRLAYAKKEMSFLTQVITAQGQGFRFAPLLAARIRLIVE